MDDILYKPGHGISRELIVNTLEALGCKEITDNDYYARCTEEGLRPDFVCKLEGIDTAVEIGGLNNLSVCDDKRRIRELLKKFYYVIHIFSSKKFYLLHCILYSEQHIFNYDLTLMVEGQERLTSQFKNYLKQSETAESQKDKSQNL